MKKLQGEFEKEAEEKVANLNKTKMKKVGKIKVCLGCE